jgi:hypothetical protein
MIGSHCLVPFLDLTKNKQQQNPSQVDWGLTIFLLKTILAHPFSNILSLEFRRDFSSFLDTTGGGT